MQVDYPTRAVKLSIKHLIQRHAFAEELCYLHTGKFVRPVENDRNVVHIRDRNDTHNRDRNDVQPQSAVDGLRHKHVTEWMIGSASDRDSHTVEFPIISKKMRDDPTLGFRRSGLWTTMKVFLQLTLTIALKSPVHGKFAYKIIILKFMSTMCKQLTEYSEANLNMDTVDTFVELLAKTARRIDKLSKLSEAEDHMPYYVQLAAQVRNEAIEAVSSVRHILNTIHKKMLDTEKVKTILSTLAELKFEEHTTHKSLSELKMYLDKRSCSFQPKLEKIEENEEKGAEMHEIFNPKIAPNVTIFKSLDSDNDCLRFLYDVENWVLEQMDANTMQLDPKYLRKLATPYMQKAHHFYKNDPIGYSRMVLTTLKIIQVRNTLIG